MEITLNNKTYYPKTIKAKMVRKAIGITENISFEKLKTDDMDNLVDFIVETFDNQFSRDDIYDNLESHLLISTIVTVLKNIINGMDMEINKFPKT